MGAAAKRRLQKRLQPVESRFYARQMAPPPRQRQCLWLP